MNFRIGQKVVCIDTENFGNPGPPDSADRLVKGGVYTVSLIGLTRLGHPGISVAELKQLLPGVARYRGHRFRPVIERKTETGMAILREILDRESHQDKPPVKRAVDS